MTPLERAQARLDAHLLKDPGQIPIGFHKDPHSPANIAWYQAKDEWRDERERLIAAVTVAPYLMDFSQKEPFELHRGRRDFFDPELADVQDLLGGPTKRRFGAPSNPNPPAWCGPGRKDYMAQKKRESRARQRAILQKAS